jgi:EmrB/QacA subfamily drug resistance transporter
MPESSSGRSQAGPTTSSGAASSSIASSSRPWVFAAALATIFMAAIEGTIVATATPTIVGELGGFELLSWVFTAYLLTQAITIPIYGRLADLYGRKRMLLIGIALFLVGSILCGLAWDMVSLIAFRVVQGIGTGALVPVAMTIVGDLYTPAERARMQGYISTVWSISAVVGPILGAFIVAHANWPWIFWLNIPIAIGAAILLVVALQERLQPREHQMDYGGLSLLALGIGCLMFALIQASSLTTAMFLGLLAVSAATLAALVVHENRTSEPILPMSLWRNRLIATSAMASVCVGAITMGSSVFLSLYVQNVMGRSATVAAYVLMAMSFSWMFGSIAGGRLMLKTSYRMTVASGGLWLAPGAVMLVMMTPDSGPVWPAAAGFLIGIGLGFVNNTFTVVVQAAVEQHQRGIATSSLVFTRIIGQSVGTALYGGILNAGVSQHLGGATDIVSRLMDPGLRESLPAASLGPLITAMADALHKAYILQAVAALIAVGMALCLPAGLSPVQKAKKDRSAP